LLEDYGRQSIALTIRPDGSAVGTPGNRPFTRIDPTGAAAVKGEAMHPIADALAATKPGLVYSGKAISKQRGNAETLILRFTDQGTDGVTVRATLESATNAGWARPFHGAIIGNTYRAGVNPIRLMSADNDRVAKADPKSPLGIYTATNSLTIALHAEGKRLVGEDDRFSYQFDVADPASSTGDGSQATGDSLSTVHRRLSPVGPGDSSQSTGHTALAPAAAPPPAAAATSPQSSEDRGQRSDSTNVTGVPSPRIDPGVPSSTLSPVPRPLSPEAAPLPATPDLPTPLSPVTSLPSVGPAKEGPLSPESAHDAPIAPLPVVATAATAAYVLDGQWLPLPRNKPHWSDAELTFDGYYYVPVISGREVVIAYVGSLTRVGFEQPEAKALVELAPTRTATNGIRSVALAPGSGGFGRNRIAATLERATLQVIAGSGEVSAVILRCSAPIPPGHYAVLAGPNAYELEIE
jgi:hypothetical protein